jgi:hypothetical protein
MKKSDFWWRLVNLNPALYRGVIMSTIWALTSLGIAVSDTVPNAFIVLIGAVFAMAQAFWTKPAVTPNAKVVVYMDDPNNPKQVSAGEGVTTASDKAIIEAAQTSGE